MCCGTADGMLPPCEPCQPTVWAGSDGNSRASSGGASGSGSHTGLPLLPSAAARHNGSARALATAWQEQPALRQEGRPNGKACGRELGRWVTPFRCAAFVQRGRSWCTGAPPPCMPTSCAAAPCMHLAACICAGPSLLAQTSTDVDPSLLAPASTDVDPFAPVPHTGAGWADG